MPQLIRWNTIDAVRLSAAAALALVAGPCLAERADVANFYAGKQITLIVGTGPGGGLLTVAVAHRNEAKTTDIERYPNDDRTGRDREGNRRVTVLC